MCMLRGQADRSEVLAKLRMLGRVCRLRGAGLRRASSLVAAPFQEVLPVMGSVRRSSVERTGAVMWGQQRRAFAGDSQDSHDDFKPKRKAAPSDLDDAVKMVEEQVKKYKVMLYMKGTPAAPQCGFSAQVVRVLHASGVDFDSVNVLDYPLLREGVKKFANWPTIPQLYIDGEFVGGCDIITSLFQSGELAKILEESAQKAK